MDNLPKGLQKKIKKSNSSHGQQNQGQREKGKGPCIYHATCPLEGPSDESGISGLAGRQGDGFRQTEERMKAAMISLLDCPFQLTAAHQGALLGAIKAVLVEKKGKHGDLFQKNEGALPARVGGAVRTSETDHKGTRGRIAGGPTGG